MGFGCFASRYTKTCYNNPISVYIKKIVYFDINWFKNVCFSVIIMLSLFFLNINLVNLDFMVFFFYLKTYKNQTWNLFKNSWYIKKKKDFVYSSAFFSGNKNKDDSIKLKWIYLFFILMLDKIKQYKKNQLISRKLI